MTVRGLLLLLLTSACVTPGWEEQSRPLTGTTIVSLTFDDTLADQYQVGDLLATRGLVGTFYVNSPRLARSGYMSLDQVLTLQRSGNEIGGHTLDHVDLTVVSEAEMIRQVCDDRDALLAAGLTVTSFAYPYSADNATVRNVVQNCNYNSARDGGGLLSATCNDCPTSNPIPPPSPYQIRTNSSVKSTDTLETLQQFVIGAEQDGGGWVPIAFHHVCDGCSPNGISPALLTEFLDWLAARKSQGTEVATVHQVIGGEVKPPVNAPPPPPPPTDNLLQNPSLEIDANRDQVPDCWYRGGSGTNTATYTLVPDAADGSVAQRIDMTSFTSGARRLVSKQDAGTCAPAAVPGHTYTMRAAYRANTPPIFSVYYRTTAGTWKWLSQSPRLATSSSYVTAQYKTPPLPADATAISVGLAITAVGFIVMDDYSLVDDQAAPPPPPPEPTPNLLNNPSLEVDANGDQVPDCWYRGGSGTNTATYTLVANAADGNVAQRIDITSYTSGARRLVPRQDVGTCAPAAKPGHTYTMSAAYIATTQPLFSVYIRDTAGTWRWFAQSTRFPTASSYVSGQYTTPPLPADAAGISVGLAITGVGYIIMDAYSLVDDQAE
jgi:peptidoglycan/xylan/chitin deacetylase (PgdA/CDA1 family)